MQTACTDKCLPARDNWKRRDWVRSIHYGQKVLELICYLRVVMAKCFAFQAKVHADKQDRHFIRSLVTAMVNASISRECLFPKLCVRI